MKPSPNPNPIVQVCEEKQLFEAILKIDQQCVCHAQEGAGGMLVVSQGGLLSYVIDAALMYN